MTEKSKNEHILEAALRRIIEVNRNQAAENNDGDPRSAETWVSTILAREVLDFIDEERGSPRLCQTGFNLNGFYYKFLPTGVSEVDAIMHAITNAVSVQRDSSQWSKPAMKAKGCDGETPFDWIQNACDIAALEVQKNENQELVVMLSKLLLAADSSKESILDKDPMLLLQLQKIAEMNYNKVSAEKGLSEASRRPIKPRDQSKRIPSLLAQQMLEKFIYDEDIDEDDANMLRVLLNRNR